MEGQILWYEDATAHVDVFFPEGHIACQYCKLFCRYEENFQRYSCRLTDEWLIGVKQGVGRMCPLIFDKGEK